MTVYLDVAPLPEMDRAEAVRHTIAETIVHVEIAFPEERGAARGAITNLGHLTICSVVSNATTVERTARLARDDLAPSLFVALQMSGSSLVVQGGREAVLRPGDIAVYDSTRPYTLSDSEGIRQHFFRIPLNNLALSQDVIGQVTARTLSAEHPIASVTSHYLSRLVSDTGLYDQPGADGLGEPTIELVRALLASQMPNLQLARPSLDSTLSLRILEYARAHLSDHDLSAANIARAHHMSLRQLYAVMSGASVSLGDWIRERRLEECRNELARLGHSGVGVASVGRRWGFANPSHFARAFKSAYGLTPREWRDLHRASVTLGSAAQPPGPSGVKAQ